MYGFTKNDKYKDAAGRFCNSLSMLKYSNGGWPQYYPLEKITASALPIIDDAMGGIMWLLKDIAEGKPEYSYINSVLRRNF